MNLPLFAQLAGGGIAYYGMVIILIAAVIAVVWVITDRIGIKIPEFVVKILWIIAAAVVGLLAIKFLVSMF